MGCRYRRRQLNLLLIPFSMNFLKSPRRGRGQALFDSRLRLIGSVVPDKKLDLPELWGPDLQEWMRPLPWAAGTHSAARSLAQSKRSRLRFT